MSNINGGFVEMPSGVDHRYVAVDNEYGFKWKLISELEDRRQHYGLWRMCASGSGQMVPNEKLATSWHNTIGEDRGMSASEPDDIKKRANDIATIGANLSEAVTAMTKSGWQP